jgi:hypothetical protein
MLKRRFIAIWTTLALSTVAWPGLPVFAQPPKPADESFVPISELPPGQELPAAPFLVGAYAFFLVLVMYYLWTIWRRIARVEAEMQTLQRRQAQGGGPR